MKKEVHVALDWKFIEWLPDEKWMKDTLPKLIEADIDPRQIHRSVYVIRLHGEFAIDYPNGESPTVYIGEGNFSSRIKSHRSWVSEIRELVREFSFQVGIVTPRVANNPEAYLDTEAALLDRFAEKFHTAPLWNKQYETRRCQHYSYSQQQMDYAICKRSGAKYKWAIRPMKSSPFHASYLKTHI